MANTEGRALVVWASLTGNTRRLAEAIHRHLGEMADIAEVGGADAALLEGYDAVILCYWCWRGRVDPQTQAFIDSMKGRRIVICGTLGAYDDGPYADRVRERARAAVEQDNTCLGSFLCRGKINPARTEARRKIPPGEHRHLDEAGYIRHMSSHPHPTEQDLKNACDFVDGLLKG